MTVHAQRSGGVEAVGLLLADNHGGLNVVAASSEQARVLELFQLQHAAVVRREEAVTDLVVR
ncbi:hypothetical protein [Mycobacterium sp. HUMS_1102779]|uniref:hypothetical protein n=1 Tax=Mycobacterium sp. HUMS_1102779 TaxID=3383487 RepID=UPI00389A4B5C